MKLQLYSQTIREGVSQQAIFNGSEASRGIFDVHIGRLFKLPQYFGETISMLSMTGDGMYLYVILPLSSRIGDYLSLVLFVPRQLMITAASDISIIHETMKTVLRDNNNIEPLRHYFDWDYTPFDLTIDGKTTSNNYACLLLENENQSLSAFLSKPVLYCEVMRYMGVFLLPPSLQQMVKGDNIPTLRTAMLSAPKLSLHAEGENDTTHTDSPKPSAPSKKSPKVEEKKKLSRQWLWGIVIGTLIGLAIGIVTSKWLLPQSQKPSMTNPIPSSTMPNDTLPSNDTLPEDASDNKTDTPPPMESTSYLEDTDDDFAYQRNAPYINDISPDDVDMPNPSDTFPGSPNNSNH